MIAFLANTIDNGRAILRAEFPYAKIEAASGRVWFNPDAPTPDGRIISSDRQLQGIELSGLVMLTEVKGELLTAAYYRVRKPFYYHAKDRATA